MVIFAANGQKPDTEDDEPLIAELRRRLDHLVSGAKVLGVDLNERTEAVVDLFRQSQDMADGECRLTLCVWGVRFDYTDSIKPRDAANDEKLVGFLGSIFDRTTRLLDEFRRRHIGPNN